MKNSVIIVAGGDGLRMKSSIPKQFIEINSKPIIIHTINKFIEFDNNIEIIVVMNMNYIDLWNSIEAVFKLGNIKTTFGGENRFESVKNGLKLVNKGNIVAIHDSVRPLVSLETIKKTFELSNKKGNAIPYCNINESLRIENNGKLKTIDRNTIKIIQTPQVFKYEQLESSYNCNYSNVFTDDATVVESKGYILYFIEGNKENIKITESIDLLIAKELMSVN